MDPSPTAPQFADPSVEDLGLGRKRAAIRGKGGHREIIVWDAATVRLSYQRAWSLFREASR